MDRGKLFGSYITKLMDGEDLSFHEALDAWSDIIRDKQSELQQGAFLSALTIKGESSEEISAAWEAIYRYDTTKVSLEDIPFFLDNCGTGMDSLKTFNISTVSSIVASSLGVCLTKHGSRALTSSCGTVDLLEQLGVDVESPVSVVERSIRDCGIGIFNGMSGEVHPEALFRILSKIRFGSTLNIAGSLANPANPRYGVRGVYSSSKIKQVVETMRGIGYKKALVFHGFDSFGNDGMDEISPIGKTLMYELDESGAIYHYTLSPKDFGISPCRYEDILPGKDLYESTAIVADILSGRGSTAQEDAVCINTAPILYLAKVAKTFEEGTQMARQSLKSGKALEQLKKWVISQNRDVEAGVEKFNGWFS